MKKLTLILPDIHHRIDIADKIIRAVGADVVICVGDYFDSFDETPQMVFDTAEWLVEFVKKDNHIAIKGNHDQHYVYSHNYFRCSGYEQWKYFQINDIVKKSDWDRLKYYHILDNMWLLTHAGLHEHFIPDNIKLLSDNKTNLHFEISKFLDDEIMLGLRNKSWIFHAGQIRGGNQLYGGIVWCDSREFVPCKGLHQIFGHTVFDRIRWKNMFGQQTEMRGHHEWSPKFENLNNSDHSYNLCLDTGLSHYATWDGKTLKVHWIGDL